jgi:hypothetical protein
MQFYLSDLVIHLEEEYRKCRTYMPAVAAKVLIVIVQENVFFCMCVCDSSSYMILLSRIIYAGSPSCSQ